MNLFAPSLVARLLWIAPALLLVIAVLLTVAALDQREAAQTATAIEAEVVSLNLRERSEITRGSVRLRYAEGLETVERDVELPMSFLKGLEGREGETIPIYLAAGSDQVVLGEHPRAQWILTFSFAAMALMGALGLIWMVGAWNRHLSLHGDPALRTTSV